MRAGSRSSEAHQLDLGREGGGEQMISGRQMKTYLWFRFNFPTALDAFISSRDEIMKEARKKSQWVSSILSLIHWCHLMQNNNTYY
jgi:hypothetical protein